MKFFKSDNNKNSKLKSDFQTAFLLNRKGESSSESEEEGIKMSQQPNKNNSVNNSNNKQLEADQQIVQEEEQQPAQNNINEPNPIIGAAGGINRRDENSISFRHFLNPHSDVVPRSVPRSPRGHSASIDLVEGSGILPDFVQESHHNPSSSGDSNMPTRARLQHGPSSLDLPNRSDDYNLQDYNSNSSQRNRSTIPKSSRRRHEMAPVRSMLRNIGGECSGAVSSSSTAALPDFLSDGPMLWGGVENSNNNPGAVQNEGEATGNNQLDSNQESSIASNLYQIECLRRENLDKSRRIQEVETELANQRSETIRLETRANLAEEEILRLKSEISILKEQLRLMTATEPNPIANGEHASLEPSQIMAIASSSEDLVRKLSEQINHLKLFAEFSGDSMSIKDKNKESKNPNKKH